MASSDVFLHQHLTPNTDVELYASAASASGGGSDAGGFQMPLWSTSLKKPKRRDLEFDDEEVLIALLA